MRDRQAISDRHARPLQTTQTSEHMILLQGLIMAVTVTAVFYHAIKLLGNILVLTEFGT